MSVAATKKVLTLPEIKPLQAIRAKCLDCSCGSSYEVKNCVIKDCALYPYRLGKNPYSEAQNC